nr:COBRA-like protein 7 [Coffea arabica]
MAKIFSFLNHIILPLLIIITISLPTSISQLQEPTNTPNGVCNGVVIQYNYDTGYQIPPTLLPGAPDNQPYRFESTLTVLNAGFEELKNWKVFVGFQHNEYLYSASEAVLDDGTSLPGNVSQGAVFSGSPVTDLKTSVETAGDLNQMMARVELVGTQFGVAPPNAPLPSNLGLANDGYLCSGSNMPQGVNLTQVCCIRDLKARSNITTEQESPLQSGDISIMYDVTSAYEKNYWAQVTISNENPISRLDYWKLTWEWMREEFIYQMKGAYPTVLDTKQCVFGAQGEYYKDLDFSIAVNCERRPTIIDLPPDRTNDTKLGMIPFCCRNGSLLPPTLDPTRSKSAFVMQVYKMKPDLNRTQIYPPINWKINGTSGPEYQCGQPVRVSSSFFPNPQGLSSDVSAVASWQIVCNISQAQTPQKKPNCCVSFSSFFNDSVVPCNTCACGCNLNPSNMCNATAPALLLPPDALLVPFDNRTKKAIEFSKLKHRHLPNPLPCGDNCGVSINWHLLSDFEDGWTARITLFNWGDTSIADWSAAVELDKAMPGFEAVYSFNGTIIPDSNNTLFLYGHPGLNYLVAETEARKPRKDPPIPGSQQSVILFTKKKTPGINVPRGDGFPSKVYFNGEECSLPTRLPISFTHRLSAASASITILLSLFVLMAVLQ